MAYLQLEILIRSLVRRMFRILGRPFEAVRADDGVSRRDECISTGRERPGSSPRGPGVILEPCSDNGKKGGSGGAAPRVGQCAMRHWVGLMPTRLELQKSQKCQNVSTSTNSYTSDRAESSRANESFRNLP